MSYVKCLAILNVQYTERGNIMSSLLYHLILRFFSDIPEQLPCSIFEPGDEKNILWWNNNSNNNKN